MIARTAFLATVLLGVAVAMPAVDRPNFVWLHVESTDGRTYTDAMSGGENPVVPIPRIRSLKARGALFVNHYANVPICCPSLGSSPPIKCPNISRAKN